MNIDNKKPGRKPLYVYYIIAAVVIILLNVLLLPAIEDRKVQTTDYSTFLTGVEKNYVTTVEIQDDYIYYVAESDGQQIYCKTVKVNDPDLVDRLHDANVKFGARLQELMYLSLFYSSSKFSSTLLPSLPGYAFGKISRTLSINSSGLTRDGL